MNRSDSLILKILWKVKIQRTHCIAIKYQSKKKEFPRIIMAIVLSLKPKPFSEMKILSKFYDLKQIRKLQC